MTQPEKFEGDSQRTKIIMLAVLLVAGIAGLDPGNSLVNDPATSPLAVALVYGFGAAWVGICVWLGVSIANQIGSKEEKRLVSGGRICVAEKHRPWCGKTAYVNVIDAAGVTAWKKKIRPLCQPLKLPTDGSPPPPV